MTQAQENPLPNQERQRPIASCAETRERAVARAFLLVMRSRKRVVSVEDLALAADFAVFEAPWTTYCGMYIALQRGLSGVPRELAIARGIALALAEWAPGLSPTAVEQEIRSLFFFPSLSVSSDALAS